MVPCSVESHMKHLCASFFQHRSPNEHDPSLKNRRQWMSLSALTPPFSIGGGEEGGPGGLDFCFRVFSSLVREAICLACRSELSVVGLFEVDLPRAEALATNVTTSPQAIMPFWPEKKIRRSF